MNQDGPSHTTSAPQAAANHDAEGGKAIRRQSAIEWPWPAMLLAHVAPEPLDASGTPACRVLILSPTADGLEDLAETECVLTDLWLVFVEAEGQLALHGQRVEEISTWNSRTPGGRQLSVLHCEGGRQIAIEDESIFEFQAVALDWRRVVRPATMSSVHRSTPDSSGLMSSPGCPRGGGSQ